MLTKQEQTMKGYAKVGQLMATYDQLAILRGFKSLSYQSLLYRQAEIIHLQDDLEKLIQRDAAHPSRQQYSRDWWHLAHNFDSDEDEEQWKLWQHLNQKLDEYSKCTVTIYPELQRDILIKDILQVTRLICHLSDDRLFKHTTLSKLDAPNESNLSFLREWLERPTMGSFPIRGLDMGAWDVQEDLVALNSAGPQDLTTRWFTNTLVPFFHRFLGEKVKVRIS